MTRRCNHHSDCDRADDKHPGGGHCHDPGCESPTAESCPWVQQSVAHTLAGPGPYDGQQATSTQPVPCWSCGRGFSIGYAEDGAPVAFHALPTCDAFDAAGTVAQIARFSEKCRLAANPRLS